MTWSEICRSEVCRGRWVAIDRCRYDQTSGRAVEGQVVDVDPDLAELLSRVRESPWKGCEILFVGDEQ